MIWSTAPGTKLVHRLIEGYGRLLLGHLIHFCNAKSTRLLHKQARECCMTPGKTLVSIPARYFHEQF